MKMKKSSVLGLAAAGVLLAALSVPVSARIAGWLYGQTLRVADTEGRGGTVINTLGVGDAYIQGDLEVAGQQFSAAPATQVIGAASTIAADACGGLKRISATADRTTDTTATFTAPAAGNAGCCMLVVNVDTVDTIYLDSNTAFPLTNVASAALGPKGSINVCSDGTYWQHTAWTEY